MGVYSDWAPIYADLAVRTFPVSVDAEGKRPAVRGYLKASDRTRQVWADSPKFAGYDALGIDLRRSGITVLDIDEPDENLLADTMASHGASPFIVRSQSGCYQAYYANSGEPRDTSKRRWNRKIDLLGGGFTVAAPSHGHRGNYEIIVGDVEDLVDLPRLENLPELAADQDGIDTTGDTVTRGRRNPAAWTYAAQQAHQCDSEADLCQRVIRYAQTFEPPLPDDEVKRAVGSAWRMTMEGRNKIVSPRTIMLNTEIDEMMMKQPDAYLLLSILRRRQWGGDDFMIADGMASTVVPFGRDRLRRARSYLVAHGYVDCVREASGMYGPALYAWPTV